jgi:small subunit ribosomal protein S27Ae
MWSCGLRTTSPSLSFPPGLRNRYQSLSHTLVRHQRADRTQVLNLGADALVSDIKREVAARQGVDVEDQCVLFGGRQLADEDSLAECGVADDSQLYVSLRLLGGGKKRKKKTYTTPKKQKHVHKKVQLRVLKLYKVSDDGKVQRLRKVCPSCGPGIFMATHFDRVYCGKCHVTYVYSENQ